MYKEFDWEQCAKQSSPERLELYKKIHNKKVSVDEFVQMILDLPLKEGKSGKSRAPSESVKNYRHLQERFGFFL